MSHFYAANGALIDLVPNASHPGEFRDTTISDARKQGLYPSVTTVIQLLNKPMVNIWRVEQGIKATMVTPITAAEMYDPELYEAYIKRMLLASEEYVTHAAEMGTRIHRGISMLLRGDKPDLRVIGMTEARLSVEVVDYLAVNNFVMDESERTFVNHRQGVAGTIDWRGWWNGKRTILDFKTREWEEDKKAGFYDEEAIQLAGYAVGSEETDADRVSLIINRRLGGGIQLKNWSEPTKKDLTPNLTWEGRWKSLLDFYKHKNSYWPERLHVV